MKIAVVKPHSFKPELPQVFAIRDPEGRCWEPRQIRKLFQKQGYLDDPTDHVTDFTWNYLVFDLRQMKVDYYDVVPSNVPIIPFSQYLEHADEIEVVYNADLY